MRLVKRIGDEFEKDGKKYHYSNYLLICDEFGKDIEIPIKCVFNNGYSLLNLVAEVENNEISK